MRRVFTRSRARGLLGACLLAAVAGCFAFTPAMAGGLLHRYSFTDGTAKDSVGKADGTVVGAVRISDGEAHFPGERGARIELPGEGPTGINLNTLKAVTVEAWYTATKEDQSKLFQRVFDFGASAGLDNVGRGGEGSSCMHFMINSRDGDSDNPGPAFAEVFPGAYRNGNDAKVVTPVPFGKQVHLAMVVDDTNLTAFIDGREAGQTALDGRTLDQLSNDYALLGASLWGRNPSLSGSIREFRIYGEARSAAKIAADFKAGPATVAP